MQHQRVLVLDFGGQYNQLIARRVRDLKVYCDLKPCDMTVEEIKAYDPVGIIFTGGPNSVYDAASPHIRREVLELGIPVLGICYGCQLIAYTLGGSVVHPASQRGGDERTAVTDAEDGDAEVAHFEAEMGGSGVGHAGRSARKE